MSPNIEAHPCSLAGAIILQLAPALRDNPSGNAAVDIALALLHSGARVIVTTYEALGACARQFAEFMFSPQTVAEAIRGVCTSLLARDT